MKHTTEELILGALLVQRTATIRTFMARDLSDAELEKQRGQLTIRAREEALLEAEDAADFIRESRQK